MIIGLTGKAGSGKDTVADYLVDKYNFKKISFAGVLKQGMKTLFDFSDDQLHHPIVKEQPDARWGKSPRELMQWLGTDILRKNIRPDFFIVHVESLIKKYKDSNIVISDVRFEDEAAMIKKYHGLLVKIIRPNHIGTKKKHISENLEVNTDYQIFNQTKKINLYDKVDNILQYKSPFNRI